MSISRPAPLFGAALGLFMVAFTSSPAPAYAEPDVIRVQAENDAYFDIGRIKLIHLTGNGSDTNRQNYRGRDGKTKSVKLQVPETGTHTQKYEFQLDPVGGLGGDSGSRVCAYFSVDSIDGKINKIEITGPFNYWGVHGTKLREWTSEKKDSQLATVYARVQGDLNTLRCDIEHIRRRDK